MTQQPETHVWNPSVFWLRQGQARLNIPNSTRSESITWSFLTMPLQYAPITLVECKMSGFGISVSGFGDGMLIKGAMIRAFAEAYERLWMLHLGDELNDLFGSKGITSSNGFAAGPTAESALSNSRGELMERALMIEAWQSMRGWNRYSLTSALSKALAAVLEFHGWKIQTFHLREKDLGSALVGIARHPQHGATFDSKWIPANQTAKQVELKLLRSILKIVRKKPVHSSEHSDFPEKGIPNDQARFYSDLSHCAQAFSFLENSSDQNEVITLSEPEKIISKLVIEATLFPAVAVSAHHNWTPLTWGKQSIRGKNPWPHPLA